MTRQKKKKNTESYQQNKNCLLYCQVFNVRDFKPSSNTLLNVY